MLRRVLPLLLSLASAIAQTAPQDPARDLTTDLKRDPAALLREIGSAPSTEAALALESQATKQLDTPTRLRLIRFGLGHREERVVFGAAMLTPNPLAVPELRHAAKIVIGRIGDADCPVDLDHVRNLHGSVDVPAILERIPQLAVNDAALWLGDIHRLVRPEHVPLLCALAQRTKGRIAHSAFMDAVIGADYQGGHDELVVTTWLHLAGVAPDADGNGLPGALTAALRWLADHPDPPRHATDPEPPDGELWRPETQCDRWLAASRASAADLPLLQHLIDADSRRLLALRRLGDLRDDTSLATLHTFANGDDEDPRTAARLALALRADSDALEALLRGSGPDLACGLFAASPERRQRFATDLLAAAPPLALDRLRGLVTARADRYFAFAPPIDDAWLAPLATAALAAEHLDAHVLRMLIAGVPACATTRLADKLLTSAVDDLFADDDADAGGINQFPSDAPGFVGIWPFLEVTRPEAFRARLREGLASKTPAVQATCAELLLRLVDRESTAALLTWVEDLGADATTEHWARLAALGGDDVRKHVFAHVDAATERDRERWLAACAVLVGMPPIAAQIGRLPNTEATWTALRAGDAATALFACEPKFDFWSLPEVFAWRDTGIRERLLTAVLQHVPLEDLALAQLRIALFRGDAAARATLLDLMHDGRYALHGYASGDTLTLGHDVSTLAFWIDETGTNCCRQVVAREALADLLGNWAGSSTDAFEPAVVRLHRGLIPYVARLRWSVLANAFVVAGA
jgi:hypothetical protein